MTPKLPFEYLRPIPYFRVAVSNLNIPAPGITSKRTAHIAIHSHDDYVFQTLTRGPDRSQSLTTYIVAKVENVANRPGLGRLTAP